MLFGLVVFIGSIVPSYDDGPSEWLRNKIVGFGLLERLHFLFS